MNSAIIAYVPVLHRGYMQFFAKHPGASLHVLGREILADYPELVKNLPALPPVDIVTAINGWINQGPLILAFAKVLRPEDIQSLQKSLKQIWMPDEEVSRAFAAKHLDPQKVKYDASWFLRRDKQNAQALMPVIPHVVMSDNEFHCHIMNVAIAEAEKSSDFWRQVGAVIVKNNELVIVGHNRHVPSEQTPYAYGDPRSNFKAGVNIELSTALHAEVGVIAEAAKRGIALEGSEIFVTTFPCPPCAKLIAYSGIKRCYFQDGYSQLDGQSILEANGVEIVQLIPQKNPSPV